MARPARTLILGQTRTQKRAIAQTIVVESLDAAANFRGFGVHHTAFHEISGYPELNVSESFKLGPANYEFRPR